MEEITKTCSRCGETKALNLFKKDSRKIIGVSNPCKNCMRILNAVYRSNNREKLLVAYTKYRQSNREKEIARGMRYRKENPEKRKETCANYYKNNLEKARTANAKWQANNPDKMRAASSRWRKNHPEMRRFWQRNRDAMKRGTIGNGWTVEQEQQLIKDYDYRCAYCNEVRELTMDHIVPLTRGGSHSIDNIVPACVPCNSSKRNKPLLIWLYQRRLKYDKQMGYAGTTYRYYKEGNRWDSASLT